MIKARRDDVTRRWTLRLAACLVAGSGVLTGCSEKQAASDSLPSTSSAAPSQDALPPLGPEDLPMPDEARTQDAAGAEAFVRYYIELINRTSTVMDAQPLRDLSRNCRECDRLADNVETDAGAGRTYEAGKITINDVSDPVMTETTAAIPLVVDQNALIVRDSSGQPTEGGSDPYSDIPAGVALEWDAALESWLMADLTFG